jgi:hypothetical protein
MEIIGAAPTPDQLLEDLNLPERTPFIGWSVQCPDNGTFYMGTEETIESILRVFTERPDEAASLDSAIDAGRIAAELNCAALIVALFDFGEDIGVVPIGGNQFSEFARPRARKSRGK